MGDIVLKVDIEVMDQKASDLEGQCNSMQQLMADMKSCVDGLVNCWDADEGANFIGKFGYVKTEIEDSINNLNTHIQKLRQAAEIYRTAAANVNNSVEQLSTTNIF